MKYNVPVLICSQAFRITRADCLTMGSGADTSNMNAAHCDTGVNVTGFAQNCDPLGTGNTVGGQNCQANGANTNSQGSSTCVAGNWPESGDSYAKACTNGGGN